MAITFLARWAKGIVNAPRPAPISITISSGSIPAFSTICLEVKGLIRKCCPNFFWGFNLYFSKVCFGERGILDTWRWHQSQNRLFYEP